MTSRRSNIAHRIPLLKSQAARGSEPALIVAAECCADLSQTFEKVLCVTKIATQNNNKLDGPHAIYILGVTKANKVAVQKLTIIQKESEIEFEVAKAADVEDHTEGTSYSIVNEDARVCVVRHGAIICLNPNNLEDRQTVAVDGEPQLHSIGDHVAGVQFAQPQSQPVEPQESAASTDDVAKQDQPDTQAVQTNVTDAKSQDTSSVNEQVPDEQNRSLVELLSEGDCDLTELRKVFACEPLALSA